MSSPNQIFIIIISLDHLHISLLLNCFNSDTAFNQLNLIVNIRGKFFRALKTSGATREPFSDNLFEILISKFLYCLFVVVYYKVVDLLGVRHK